MSKYYEHQNRNKRGSKSKIGFYAAFAICLVAVCMAVYSTYNTVINPTAKLSTTPTDAQQVNQAVTGVTVTVPSPTISFEEPTEALPEITLPTAVSDEAAEPTTEDTTYSDDALQTMLSADLSLSYPVAGGKVVRPYSKDSVYFKTLNVWKPHLGTDFAADLGDNVLAMCGGEVTNDLENLGGDGKYTKTIVCPDGCVIFRLTATPLGNENFHKGKFWDYPDQT